MTSRAWKAGAIYPVMKYLYLGDIYAAQNEEGLISEGITDVMNCIAEDADNFFDEDFRYIELPLEDDKQVDLSPHFKDIFKAIAKVKADDGKIFIHCADGVSISCAVVIAYLLQSAKKVGKYVSLEMAMKMVEDKVPNCAPGLNLLHQLSALEFELTGEKSLKLAGAGTGSRDNKTRRNRGGGAGAKRGGGGKRR